MNFTVHESLESKTMRFWKFTLNEAAVNEKMLINSGISVNLNKHSNTHASLYFPSWTTKHFSTYLCRKVWINILIKKQYNFIFQGSFCYTINIFPHLIKKMLLYLTEVKCNFAGKPLTSFSSTLAKVFLNGVSLETFITIIFRLIIFWHM